jgi:hypothetical protein
MVPGSNISALTGLLWLRLTTSSALNSAVCADSICVTTTVAPGMKAWFLKKPKSVAC